MAFSKIKPSYFQFLKYQFPSRKVIVIGGKKYHEKKLTQIMDKWITIVLLILGIIAVILLPKTNQMFNYTIFGMSIFGLIGGILVGFIAVSIHWLYIQYEEENEE